MFSFFRNWQAERAHRRLVQAQKEYRRLVFNRVRMALFPLPSDDSNRLLRSFKGLPAAIDDYHTECATIEKAAVGVLCAILPHVIEGTFSSDRRKEVLAAIQQLAAGASPEEILAHPDQMVPMVLGLEDRVNKWVLMGLVSPEDQRILIDEVLGTLAGEPHDQRVVNRLFGGLLESIIPPDVEPGSTSEPDASQDHEGGPG